ncbi:conserved hypothetical protein (apicoplast) [Theileria equi strain WA]|uniref:Uncharacterized protein n=1 Tax=Theileria equi strain WA TaxID=1537102 RepID=L1L983_THEEQ|nr:conserved hypothetical protein [Theileria equi strain WA]EKX71967.1 conserved hypothetical protein [Theileria equi strain WA]|eukprot:XP_025033560.1 conserved hypothetical protein (apicoplast) [Theileria equi strain WA]
MNKQLNKNLKNIYNNTNKKIQTINNILEIDRCIDNTLWFFSIQLCIQLFQEDDHKNLNLHLRGRLDIYQKIKTTVTDIYTFLKYLTIYLIQKYYYKTSEVEFIKTMLYGKWEERRDMFEFFSTLNRYIRPNNAPKPSRWWIDIYIITLFWILHIPTAILYMLM